MACPSGRVATRARKHTLLVVSACVGRARALKQQRVCVRRCSVACLLDRTRLSATVITHSLVEATATPMEGLEKDK